METKLEYCPVCNEKIEPVDLVFDPDKYPIDCMVCGNFSILRIAKLNCQEIFRNDPEISSIVGYSIRKMQKVNERPLLTPDLVKNIIENNRLPSPAEQAENLILWLGETLKSPGEEIHIKNQKHYRSYIGAISGKTFGFILEHLIAEGSVLVTVSSMGDMAITLSFQGWQEYEQIKRGNGQSRKAFMAMPFGNKLIERVFRDHFKPAVEKTGFKLYRLDEEPKAGSIDDRLRVDILTLRFLIADLTHGNHGAYWEAGFAEGLGKPVIYSCEKEFFEKNKTHFDTNHLHTVIWEASNL